MDVVTEKAATKILPYVKLIERNLLRGPLSIHILLTDFCVNKCNMCGHWHTLARKNMEFSLVEAMWADLNANDCESVCFTGGDPILHPKFNQILDLERQFELGMICTANYKSNFDFEQLRRLAWVRYSIDSLVPEKYAIIRGYNNLESKILPCIRRSLDYNSCVGVNFTIQRMNSNEVADIIKFCVGLGVYRVMLYPMHGDDELCIRSIEAEMILSQLHDVRVLWDSIPENNFAFLQQSLEAMLEQHCANVREAVFDYAAYPCMINKIHLSVGADGRVFPCEVSADDTDAYGERQIWAAFTEAHGIDFAPVADRVTVSEIGNINVESLNDIWKRNYHNSFRCTKCDRCFGRYQPIIQMYHHTVGKRVFV